MSRDRRDRRVPFLDEHKLLVVVAASKVAASKCWRGDLIDDLGTHRNDGVAGTKLTKQQHLGQGILNVSLQGPLQRSCAVRRVVSAVGQESAGIGRQLQLQVT